MLFNSLIFLVFLFIYSVKYATIYGAVMKKINNILVSRDHINQGNGLWFWIHSENNDQDHTESVTMIEFQKLEMETTFSFKNDVHGTKS